VPNDLRTHPMAWVRFAALPLDLLDDVKSVDDMWADQRVRDAVRLASPSLADALSRRGTVDEDDQNRGRAYRGLRGYYARMGTRPTPFGLMAGVFSARVESAASIATLDLDLTAHLRCEETAEGPDDITADTVLQANPGLERAGGGFLVPPRGSLRARSEQCAYIPATDTMRHVRDLLGTPARVADAVARLSAETGSSPDTWLTYLRSLYRRNIVVRAETIGIRPWLTITRAPHGCPETVLRQWSEQRALGIDSSVDAFADAADGAGIPAELGRHAVTLCNALDLAAPTPAYPDHLAAMARDFTDRFGPAAEVPLPIAFLLINGIPLRRPEPSRRLRDPRSTLTPRERILSAAIDTAGLAGTIDDTALPLLTRLAAETDPGTPAPYAPAQEVTLRPTVDATAGLCSEMTFVGAVSALGGRFVHLLTPRGQAGQDALITAIDRSFGAVEVAELVVTPMVAGRRVSGIAPVVASRRRMVSVTPGVIVDGHASTGAEDILVGVEADSGRFYIRSMRSGRRMHIVQSSMARDELLQPLEAFLLQVCRAQFRFASPFDWGALSARTFLPGVRVGSVFLCTARWLINDHDVRDGAKPLHEWMDRWEIPNRFVAREVGSDRGFLIRRAIDDDILLRMIRRTAPGEIEIKHAPDATGTGPIRDASGHPRVADIVVTVLREPVGVPASMIAAPAPAVVTSAMAAGAGWTAFDLSVPWAAVPDVLSRHVGAWLEEHVPAAAGGRAWWDVTRSPEPNIRVHLPAATAADLDVAEAFWRWCRFARAAGDLGRIVQTDHHVYEGLFADPALLGQAHEFFAADAWTTLAVVRGTSVHSAAYALRCGVHLYWLLAGSGLRLDRLRTLVRQHEQDGGREMHRQIGRDLWTEAAHSPPTDWLDRWQALAGAAAGRMDTIIGPIVALSLDRLCVSSALRPHLHGAVRRLLDRRIHEQRSVQ
jgi:lantibiotic biosynthesis protein